MQSDLFFNLGYIVLWSGLFTIARTGLFRRIIVWLFHGLTLCIVLITTVAYQYRLSTGSTLDYDMLILGFSSIEDMRGLLASQVNVSILVSVLAMLSYSVLGPSMATSFAGWWFGYLDTRYAAAGRWRHLFRLLTFVLIAAALFWLSLLPGFGLTGSKAFARDAFVNVLMTTGEVVQGEELEVAVADSPAARLPAEARLQSTPSTRRRNVVLIILESTRAAATTPYNAALPDDALLDELAKSSLLVEQAYAIVPHTHSALAAINCGNYPPLDASTTGLLAIPGIFPEVCLPHLLEGARVYHGVLHVANQGV